MSSFRQIEANRRNARLSTGPVTEEGKRKSRQNALRHGLTAETVIDALEDAEDYAGFEMAVTADYDAQSAVERELVLRLASLLWRLRRATAIESGLFASLAHGVFLERATTFRYSGEETLRGRRAVRYNYQVPQVASGYSISSGNNRAIVGFSGAFWADAETLQVMRLASLPEPKQMPCLNLEQSTFDGCRATQSP